MQVKEREELKETLKQEENKRAGEALKDLQRLSREHEVHLPLVCLARRFRSSPEAVC